MIDRHHAIDAEFADRGAPPTPPPMRRRRKRAPRRSFLARNLPVLAGWFAAVYAAGVVMLALTGGFGALAVAANQAGLVALAAMFALQAWMPE